MGFLHKTLHINLILYLIYSFPFLNLTFLSGFNRRYHICYCPRRKRSKCRWERLKSYTVLLEKFVLDEKGSEFPIESEDRFQLLIIFEKVHELYSQSDFNWGEYLSSIGSTVIIGNTTFSLRREIQISFLRLCFSGNLLNIRTKICSIQ